MSNISLNHAQIIDPVSFKSINLAKIYIGEYGTLPNPANAATWKQAYFVNSDGTRTAASQPIRTNAAGYAVDGSGNIKTIQVDGGYSLLVQDQFSATKFSTAKAADIWADLSASNGASLVGIGESDLLSVADALPIPAKVYAGYAFPQLQTAVSDVAGDVAVNDGETDITVTGDSATLTSGRLVGFGGALKTTEISQSVLRFDNGAFSRVSNPRSIGITYKQPDSYVMGGGTANNHACLAFNASDYPIAVMNTFPSVDIGMKFHYGDPALSDRSTKYGLSAFNNVAGARVMGIENHGGQMCRTVGNAVVGEGTGGRSHGLRITGLNTGTTVYPAECNAAAANVITNMLTAASFQTTARHNIYSAIAFKALAGSNCTALQFTPVANTLPVNYVQKGNVVSISGFGADYGIYNDGAELNDITVSFGDTAVRGIYEDKSASTHGAAGGNNYRGVIRNATGRAIDLRPGTAGYDQLDLQIYGNESDRTLTTLAANIASDNNSGKLHIRHANTGLTISGNNNVIDVQISDIASNFALNISGAGNTIRGFISGNVSISGANNTFDGTIVGNVTCTGASAVNNRIRGNITGTVTQSSGASGTDIELLTDAATGKRGKDKRTLSVTTNGSGSATFNHNLMDIGGSKFVQCSALGAYSVQTTAVTATTATVTVRDAATGAAVASTTVTLYIDGAAFFA